jgi:hypothetical protein
MKTKTQTKEEKKMYHQPYPVYQTYWPAYYLQPPQQLYYTHAPQNQYCQVYTPEAEPVCQEDPLINVTKSKIKVQRAVVHILKQLQTDSTETQTQTKLLSTKHDAFSQTALTNENWKKKAQQLQLQVEQLQQEVTQTKKMLSQQQFTASKWIAKAKKAHQSISVLREAKKASNRKAEEEKEKQLAIKTQLKRLKKAEETLGKLKCMQEAKELVDLQLTNVIATNMELQETNKDLRVKYSQITKAHNNMVEQWKLMFFKNKKLKEEKNNLVGQFAQVTALNLVYLEKLKTVEELEIEKNLLVTKNGILHESNKELKSVQLHLFCKEIELCLARAFAPEVWMCIHRYTQVINLRSSEDEQRIYFPLQDSYIDCKHRILKLHGERRDLFNAKHWEQYKVDFNAIYEMMQPITLAFPFYELVLDPDHYAQRPNRVDWLASHVNPLLLLP